MSTTDQNVFERIEVYLTGKMTEKDVLAFESELSSNQSLREEVEVYRELQTSIELGGLVSVLEDIKNENFVRTKKNRGTRWFGLAAGLAVFLALSYWIVSYQPKNEKLFAEYTTTDPGMPVPMSATNQYDFYDAMVDYKTGKNELALQKWSELLIEEPHNDTLLYFTASAHFNLAHYETALQFYAQMGVDSATPYFDKAQWYTILCDLKLDNRKSILAVTPNPNSPYTEQILTIQESLKE